MRRLPGLLALLGIVAIAVVLTGAWGLFFECCRE